MSWESDSIVIGGPVRSHLKHIKTRRSVKSEEEAASLNLLILIAPAWGIVRTYSLLGME
jgi:hypothetical protein